MRGKFAVENLSSQAISSSVSAQDSSILLAFSYLDEANIPTEEQAFSFTLTKDSPDGEIALDINGLLFPPVPLAHSMNMYAPPGEITQDTLRADYAATFAIDSPPTNGTLTLIDDSLGIFEYEPNKGFTGSDCFTFLAINSSDSSEVAVVELAVQDPSAKFGTWKYVGANPCEGEYLGVFPNGEASIIYQSYKWLSYNASDPNRSECWSYTSDVLYEQAVNIYSGGRYGLIKFTLDSQDTMTLTYSGNQYKFVRATTEEASDILFCPGL